MFIGHFALGFAAKRVSPRLSLPVLLGAAQLADLIWPVLVLAGVESVRIVPGVTAFTPLDFVSYPYSHSLVALAVWGVLFAALFGRRAGGRWSFWLLTGLVLSHWMLDVVSHRPDVPLFPGGPRIGLRLWRSVPLTLTVEVPLFAAGVWAYVRATTPRDQVGRWAFAGLAAFLLIAYIGNLSGPPPSVNAIALVGIGGGALLLGWSGWVDRHRRLHE